MSSVSKESAIFYSNLDKSKKHTAIKNSILEDQFDEFGSKKNFFLKKTYVIIDSSNRNKKDRLESMQLDYEQLGVLMSSSRPGQIFLYIPNVFYQKNDNKNRKLENSSFIYFTNISKTATQINGINTRNFEFNAINNSPIFNAVSVDNQSMYTIFGWETLNEFIRAQYETADEFKADITKINFYSFFYTNNPNISSNNYSALFKTNKPNIFKLNSRQIGYPQSSYFKIFLANTFFNIYRIKLFNISLPNNVFNINNDPYSINNYKYLINNKLRFVLYSDQYLISNIDYVGARIKYDFLTKDAIYDINGYNKLDYKFRISANPQRYPNYYLANDIYQLMMFNLNMLSSNDDFFKYANNNLFEVAYFFLQQFHLHYNTDVFALKGNSPYPFGFSYTQKNPNDVNRLYYIYTSDVSTTESQTNFILRNDNTLNIKNPLVYFNDYLLYVNNESFIFVVSVCNWMDQIIKVRNNYDFDNNFGFCKLYTLQNNYYEKLVGTIQNVDISSKFITSKGMSTNGVINKQKIYYKIGIFIILPNFNESSIVGIPIYANYTSNSFNYIENSISSYIGINTENNTYNYNLFLDFQTLSYTALNSNIFHYKSDLFRKITANLIQTNVRSEKLNLIQYIMVLDSISGFAANSINGSIIYSRINDQSSIFIPNTVIDYIGSITLYAKSCHAYMLYVFDQKSFSKSSKIYTLSNQYNYIGDVLEIFDVFYNQKLSNTITGFTAGKNYITYYISNDQIKTKTNYFIKDYGNSNYFVAYSSINYLKIYENMLINGEQLIDFSTNQIVAQTLDGYQKIGVIEDVQFDLILDASLYLIEPSHYEILSETTGNNQQFAQQTTWSNDTIIIKLDKIRIIETVSNINNVVIDYKNKTLILDNNQGIRFGSTILEQPIFDKKIKMFVFKLSLKTPGINIGTIYTTNQFIASIDNEPIGTAYSIYYAPIIYGLLVEKSDDFQIDQSVNWLEYTYIKDPSSKFIKTEKFKNRNMLNNIPEKTNTTGLKNYNMLPLYEIALENGIYNNLTFVESLEKKLNSVAFMEFNYLKKTLEPIQLNKKRLNDPNYEQPRFKVIYNDTTKNININSYNIKNVQNYKALYDPINPFLFFKINNNKFENNTVIYIEVNIDNRQNNLTSNIIRQLNTEFTTRILPVFEYQVRIISPVQDLQYVKTVPEKDRIIPNNIYDILSQISLSPFRFRTNFPEKHDKMKYVGQSLKNIFGNNNSYVGSGKIVFNSGVPCSFITDELIMVISNLYYNYEDYKIGRIVKIVDEASNIQGNYGLRIQMSGNSNVSHPFYIGDIIYGIKSKAIACIVPFEWGSLTEYPDLAQLHSGLPTEDIIRYGYKNYLKLLYNESKRQYLLDYINNYSMESFLFYDSYRQVDYLFETEKINNTTNALDYWPLDEVKNCYNGFEIYFEYADAFELTQSDLSLFFLNKSQYCLFAGKNTLNEFDTPKKILGFNDENLLDVNNFTWNGSAIPWNTSFSNNTNFNQESIRKMYITYGSDNVLQQNMYLEMDDITNYSKGDTIYINNLNVRTDIQRNVFNMYNSILYNVQRIFSFDMYLTFLTLRLAFIKSGVPIAMGPNDYLGLLNPKNEITLSNGSTYSSFMLQNFAMRIPNSLYVSNNNDLIAFVNIIYNNFKVNIDTNLFNTLDENITGNLSDPPLTSENIAENYALVINKLCFGNSGILAWFVQPNNLLLWTKGDRSNYLHIQETYITVANKNIWRFEMEIMDEFFFRESVIVRDKNGIVIGKTSKNNLYKDSAAVNNSFYTLYIFVEPTYALTNQTKTNYKLDYIYSNDMQISNRIKTVPILITDANKYVYLFDTYLKFKTILQLAPDNNDVVQKCLNFNKVDSVNSLLMNLYNLDNQSNVCFKNGYFVNIARNDLFINKTTNTSPSNDFNMDGQYRIMINLLDNKSIMHLCFTQLNIINQFDAIKNTIINMQVNNFKDIRQIRALIDIFQLIVDMSTVNTALIDMEFNQHVENNMHNAFENQARLIDNLYSVCGSRNFYLEDIAYKKGFIYGSANNPSGEVGSYLNNYFQQIYSDAEVAAFKKTDTISEMCNLNNIYNKNSYGSAINDNLVVFNLPTAPFVYGVVWVPADPGEKSLYIIVPAYDIASDNSVIVFNKNNLVNYMITINFIFVDQQKSIDLNSIERNETIQSNIIESISQELNSFESSEYNKIPKYTVDTNGNITSSYLTTFRIFKLNLKYELKYNVSRGMLVHIKDYTSTIYRQPNTPLKNSNKIMVLRNWVDDKQFVLQAGCVISINFGSFNPIYQKYLNEYKFLFTEFSSMLEINTHQIYEETNLITNVGSFLNIDGKIYFEITLLNPIKYDYSTGITVVFRFNPTNTSSFSPCISEFSQPYDVPYESISNTIQNANDILTSGLATQTFISENEWYTKIFYQSEKNMDLFDLNPGGVKNFNNLSKTKINISGMKGFVVPNIGFQTIERNYYNSVSVNLEESQVNSYIKPVPDGAYDLVQIQKETDMKILNNSHDISIPGYYATIYNDNSPEQADEWIDNFNNVRWFYAVEDSNNDISNLKNVDLYQLNPTTMPQEPETLFNRLCFLLSVVPTNTFFGNKTVYRVYVLLNVKNLINLFLTSKYNMMTSFSANASNILYNTMLTTIDKIHKIKIIYYGYRESVDYDYANTFKRFQYYSVTIKGRYQGFGGNLIFDTNNSVFNSIPYSISNIKKEFNMIELDMQNQKRLFFSNFRFNTTGNRQNIDKIYKKNYNKNPMGITQNNPFMTGFNQVPLQWDNEYTNSNEIIEYYDTYPSKYGFLSNTGYIYKKTINQPLTTSTNNFFYLCIKNLDSDVIVDQNNPIGNYIIFGKVYQGDIFNEYKFKSYDVIYDIKLRSRLEELELFLLDKDGNLVNLNNLDYNLELEIEEYIDKIKNINTKNGMVF